MTNVRDETREDPGIVEQASAHVHDAASAAQEKAGELRDAGARGLGEQLDRRSTEAGTQARSVADALRRSGDELRTQGKGGVADLTEQMAQRIEQVGSYLEQKRGDEMLRDIERFARRRPWMLAGLGMLVGVAASRFVKASSEQRYGGAAAAPPLHRAGGPASPALDAPLSRDRDGGER